MGLSLFVLVATGIGWLCGTQTWLVPTVTACLVAGALKYESDWAQLARHLAWMLLAGFVISLGPLMTVWLFSGYNVYNDTFTYLVHAQWLQAHPFREQVVPSLLHPSYSQVLAYQSNSFRMGSSFFFGWAQAASPFKWSIYAYPAVIAIALTAGAQAIGGLSAALSPTRSRRLVLLWILVAGTSISGFTFGCFQGFMPQIFGLALGTAFIVLLVCFHPPGDSRRGAYWRESLPLALVFAAVGFAYSEFLPFITLTLMGWFSVRVLTDKNRRGLLAVAGCFVVWSLLFLNMECLRILNALQRQSKAVVGWPIPWSLGDFGAHAIGLHSGRGDADWWMLPPPQAGILAMVVLSGLFFWAGYLCWKKPRQLRRWSPSLVLVFFCGMAFVYFRYHVASPWSAGTGQSWNQFKLSNWISPVLLALLGSVLIMIGKRRLGTIVVGAIMVAWLGANINAHRMLAPQRMNETMRLTGRTIDPFAAYEALRSKAISAQPKGPIFLDLGGGDYKSRQIAAYFLHDLPVAADWTGDGYIYPWLPAGWESLSPATSRWLVSRNERQPTSADASADRSTFVLSKIPEFLVKRQRITGGLGLETDDSGWWVWTPDHLEVGMKAYGKLPARVTVKFTCIAAAMPRQLTVIVRSRNGIAFQATEKVSEGWQNYVSPPFSLVDPDVEIEILSRSVPVPIGSADTRLVAFLAKNVRLELALDSP